MVVEGRGGRAFPTLRRDATGGRSPLTRRVFARTGARWCSALRPVVAALVRRAVCRRCGRAFPTNSSSVPH